MKVRFRRSFPLPHLNPRLRPGAVERFVKALDAVLVDCRSFPGPIWNLGANFIKHSLQRSTVEMAGAER